MGARICSAAWRSNRGWNHLPPHSVRFTAIACAVPLQIFWQAHTRGVRAPFPSTRAHACDDGANVCWRRSACGDCVIPLYVASPCCATAAHAVALSTPPAPPLWWTPHPAVVDPVLDGGWHVRVRVGWWIDTTGHYWKPMSLNTRHPLSEKQTIQGMDDMLLVRARHEFRTRPVEQYG